MNKQSLRLFVICAAAILSLCNPSCANPERDDLVSFLDYSKEKSDPVYALVTKGLATIPKNIRKAMVESGYSVVISPTMLSAIPNWQGGTPRGWDEDSNYDNVGGLFQGGLFRMVIAEQVQSRERPFRNVPNTRAELTMRHEFGHAYDHYQGGISQTDTFCDAYNLDAQRLRGDELTRFAYFLQPNGAGNQELFAELFAAAYTPNSSDNERYTALLKAFPRTADLVMRLSPNRPTSVVAVKPAAPTKPAAIRTSESNDPRQDEESQSEPHFNGGDHSRETQLYAAHKKLSELYRQGKFTEAEPVMRTYIHSLESAGTSPDIMKRTYLSFADLLNRVHKPAEALQAKQKADKTIVDPLTPSMMQKLGVVGIKFVIRSKELPTVDWVYEDLPAWKAGIQRNDKLVKINDVTLSDGTTQDELYRLISGDPGTTVHMTVQHAPGAVVTLSVKRVAADSLKTYIQDAYRRSR